MLFFDQPGEQCGTATANAPRYNYTGGLLQARFWGFHKVDTQSAGPGITLQNPKRKARFERKWKMSILKRRLLHLWDCQTTAPIIPRPWPGHFAKKISVTLGGPTMISGTMLLPGRYEFRPLDPGAQQSPFQVFNADRTTLVATLASA